MFFEHVANGDKLTQTNIVLTILHAAVVALARAEAICHHFLTPVFLMPELCEFL